MVMNLHTQSQLDIYLCWKVFNPTSVKELFSKHRRSELIEVETDDFFSLDQT